MLLSIQPVQPRSGYLRLPVLIPVKYFLPPFVQVGLYPVGHKSGCLPGALAAAEVIRRLVPDDIQDGNGAEGIWTRILQGLSEFRYDFIRYVCFRVYVFPCYHCASVGQFFGT